MAYIIGFSLALGVAAFARLAGLDRERAFYPTVLIVVASYYVLFAVVGGDMKVVMMEAIGLVAFTGAAVRGLTLVVVALAAVNLAFGFCAGCFVYFQLQRLRR